MKYIAEFFGTFTLALVVLLSLTINPPFATPVLAAITLGLFVYTVGHISGTHLNPAVTVGIFTLGKIKPADAAAYVVAQFLGGAAAYLLVTNALGIPAQPAGESTILVFLAETLGTMLFTFGIASVVFGRAPGALSGAVVGGSLLIGIVIASGIGSGGILNPAVAFALNSPNVAYLGGAVAGSLLGFNFYRLISGGDAAPAKKK
ncbi:MAG: aquaporin [Candidatus Micrarchaeota archaeon]